MNSLNRLLCLALLCAGLQAPVRADGTDDEKCFVGDTQVEPIPAVVLAGKSGQIKCIRGADRAPSREFQIVDGRTIRKSEWNELGQRMDTTYHANGAARTRARQVVFDGGPAWDREEYWASGLLRLRGTYLQGEGAQGLVQIYHEEGPLAGELWYEKGQVRRRKQFALDGRQIADEEYLADGKLKSQMQRF